LHTESRWESIFHVTNRNEIFNTEFQMRWKKWFFTCKLNYRTIFFFFIREWERERENVSKVSIFRTNFDNFEVLSLAGVFLFKSQSSDINCHLGKMTRTKKYRYNSCKNNFSLSLKDGKEGNILFTQSSTKFVVSEKLKIDMRWKLFFCVILWHKNFFLFSYRAKSGETYEKHLVKILKLG
jgi:hypothetical protein